MMEKKTDEGVTLNLYTHPICVFITYSTLPTLHQRKYIHMFIETNLAYNIKPITNATM